MIDIKTRRVAETITFQLLDSDDEPLVSDDGKPCNATIHGPGSKRYVQANQAKSDKLFTKIAKGKEVRLSVEEAARSQAEFLASITDSLDLEYDGLTGKEKFLAIYSDPSIGFIADQVNKKVSDWGNFKQKRTAN